MIQTFQPRAGRLGIALALGLCAIAPAQAQAPAAGLVTAPVWVRTPKGSDLARVNPAMKPMECPYTGEKLMAVPALKPDVVIVHAQRNR